MVKIKDARRALRASPNSDVLLDGEDNITTVEKGDAKTILRAVVSGDRLVTECIAE